MFFFSVSLKFLFRVSFLLLFQSFIPLFFRVSFLFFLEFASSPFSDFVVFFHHNYDYFILFDFLQINSYTILKFFWDAKLITPLLIFYFLVIIWSENSISIQLHSEIIYFWIWLFGGAKYQGGDKAEARGTDEQPFSDKPSLIRCGEIYSAWQ